MGKSFKRNLIIGYTLSLLLILASSVASYISINNLLSSQGQVNHTNAVIQNLENIISTLKDAETGQRGYLLTGNEVFLEPYNGAYDRSVLLINRTKQLTADNPQQQVDCDLLNNIVAKRLAYLATLIDRKKNGGELSDSLLLVGKKLMDGARSIVTTMQNREQLLLQERTSQQSRFAAITPVIIIVSLGLAVLVTLVSFYRVNADFQKRKKLHEELAQKNEEISNRIRIIENLSGRIAAGDFSTRVAAGDKQGLGVLALSLDKMAESLQFSFSKLEEREWLQTGIAQLNKLMIGEKDVQSLTAKVIQFLTDYTKSAVGAFYLAKGEGILQLTASVGIKKNIAPATLAFGEGVAGRAASVAGEIMLEDTAEAAMVVDYSAGSLRPKSIIGVPVFYEAAVKGVVELGSLAFFTPVVQEFLQTASHNIGTAINSARDHQRLQELLSETQAQSEELQAQHEELENINAELEAQAEKLQVSEEELKVQHEELQQANQELEERSRLLEEKNELIVERNLDIQKKAEELELSTKYKSEFLANMSHELRTPLNSILLLSRLLSENHEHNLSPDQIEYAQVIQSSGKGLLTLIDEILDLSKIESGKMELEYGAVSISEVANALAALFAPMAKDKNIEFTIDTREGVPEIFQTDQLRLEQILRNLLSNALKFTKRGSVSLIISERGNDLLFAVHDTGIGIPKEKHNTVFEAFQQADGSTRRQFGGTGLGLSISRELARLLGGEIVLESEEGKGSIFTLQLPQQRKSSTDSFDESKNDEMVRPPVAEKSEIQPQESQFVSSTIPASLPDDRDSLSKGDKVILIIEDDTAFAKSLLDYTRSKGYKGIVAVRGDEGIDLARRFLPLGILLDVQLPVKSGWEVMEALKSDQSTRPIPVHMMSSYQVANKSLSKGAVDFINKPVAFDKLGEMFTKIEQALSRHPKKVLIVEENTKHAKALAYFLENYDVASQIRTNISDGIEALNRSEVDCVILDMGIPAHHSYEVLEGLKTTPGFENLPIIVFTGKNLSHVEEVRIKQYADSIVVKTAHSYQRILDEVSLFLHLVEETKKGEKPSKYKRLGQLSEVLKGKTVLIADDDVRNIFSITKSLENYGVSVVSAIDGKDALKQLEEAGKVDLVLMDMMMPEMDGYESTRRIRQMPQYKTLPIIAVTAKAMTGDREKCISAGASDYITKPVDLDQLISLLRVWLYE